MDVLETINTIRDTLIAKGIDATSDPYEQFKGLTLNPPQPVALVESGDKSDIISTPDDVPYEYKHFISITCMVNAEDKKRKFEDFKPEALAFAKQVRKVVKDMQVFDLRIRFTSQKDGEFIIGSLKVSGVTIELTVKTSYNDDEQTI